MDGSCSLERATGIEPAWPAWKAGTLPLSYARAKNNLPRCDHAAKCFLGLRRPRRKRRAAKRRGRDEASRLQASERLLFPRPGFGYCRNEPGGFGFLCGLCFISSARADLTIVQKVEGVGGGG